MGSTLREVSNSSPLGRGTQFEAHKLAGVGGSVQGSSGILVSGTRLQGLDKVRQINSRSLLKQAGRDPITSALCLNLRNNDVVHGKQRNY